MLKSIKHYLVLSSTIALVIIALLSIITIFNAYTAISDTQRTFKHLSNTTNISLKLNEAHQNLRKAVLYDKEGINISRKNYLSFTEETLLILKETDPMINEISEQMNYINIYYNYQSIVNLIDSYTETGKAVLEQKDHGAEKIVLIDHIYQLGNNLSTINESLAALLFQQHLHVNNILDSESRTARKQLLITLVLSIGIYIAVILSISRLVKYISRPIHLLAEASNNIKKNVYNTVPEKQYKIEDFNILISNFNIMTLTIANSINDIKEKSILERKLLLSEKKNLEIANSLNNAQIQIMQNQINPHFLFNSLNTLTSLARIERADKTKALIEDLSKILRYGLKKTNNLVSIKEELEILNTYLRVQKIRYEEKIDYQIECEKELNQIQIPAMLLQPLVENCIVHGLEEKTGHGNISIIIEKIDDKMIKIEVSDNGKGINEKNLNLIRSQIDKTSEYSSEKSKNGLLNVLYRIKLFSPEAVILIESSEGEGTSIKFSIPASI